MNSEIPEETDEHSFQKEQMKIHSSLSVWSYTCDFPQTSALKSSWEKLNANVITYVFPPL